MTTKAELGRRAPRQRRGRNGLIGVSASRAALIGKDRSLCRKVVGGRARGRCHQDAVGDQLGHAFVFVDQDAQARGLMGLAKQRDLVDGVVQVYDATLVGGPHQKWIDQRFARGCKARMQIVGARIHSSESRRCRDACRRSACPSACAGAAFAASARHRRARPRHRHRPDRGCRRARPAARAPLAPPRWRSRRRRSSRIAWAWSWDCGLTWAPMKALRRGRLYDLAGACRDDRTGPAY